MRKRTFPLLLLSLFFACCGDDNTTSAPDNEEDEISSPSHSDSLSSKSSSSQKSNNKSSSSSFSTSYKLDPSTVQKGTFTDQRDGRVYKTVTIGKQTWMAENLNYKVDGSNCADSTDKDCKKYGRIYTWAAALDTATTKRDPSKVYQAPFQGICPDGWGIPTYADWDTLLANVGTRVSRTMNYDEFSEAGRRLLSKDDKIYPGTDVYGFSAYTGHSYYTSSNFNYQNTSYAYGYRRISEANLGYRDGSAHLSNSDRSIGQDYIRCIKNRDVLFDLRDPSSIKSTDNSTCKDSVWHPKVQPCNVYKKDNCEYIDGGVKIGDRIWSSKSCGKGWHVPDSLEWEQLIEEIGGICFAGIMLKSDSGWIAGGNGANAYGLNIMPKGLYIDRKDFRFTDARIQEHINLDSYINFHIRDGLKNYSRSYYYINEDDDIHKNFSSNIIISGTLCIKNNAFYDSLFEANREIVYSVLDSIFNPDIEYGEFTDPRDSNTYKTTIIGPQKWMAQNLYYKTDSSKCYLSKCKEYGRYYTFEDAQTACPSGWHLPSKAEYDTLIYFGAHYPHTTQLLSKYNRGEDIFGFSMILAASMETDNNKNSFFGHSANFWTNELKNDSIAYTFYGYNDFTDTLRIGSARIKNNMYSVRCVNDTAISHGYNGDYGTLTDERDGQKYKTVEINGATWMAENLRYKPVDSTRCQTYMDSIAKYGCYYQEPFKTDSTEALCPAGWHISTETDWDNLIDFVGDSAATKLRSIYGWEHVRWTNLYTTAAQGKDLYGLDLIPSGCFTRPNDMHLMRDKLNKPNRDYSPAVCLAMDISEASYMHYIEATVYNSNSTNAKDFDKHGDYSDERLLSIRCVKD